MHHGVWLVALAGGVCLAGAAAVGAGPDRYLSRDIDWHHLLPPPPTPSSPAGREDRAAFTVEVNQVGSPAWLAAISQLYPGHPEVTVQFACATGHDISAARTPATFRMLRRLAVEMSGPVEAAKEHFHRSRPYVGHDEIKVCDPRASDMEPTKLSYSYPSGHAAFGELWARALAAANPGEAARIDRFGREFGDNRIACGVHFPSDVVAGRAVADAIYELVSVTPAFKADLAAATAELAASPPPPSCGAATQKGGGVTPAAP